MKNCILIAYFLSVALTASYAQQSTKLLTIADTFFMEQDWQNARNMYEKAFANGESQTALSLNRLGFSYLSLHDYNAAIKNLEGALEKKPMPAGELIIRSRLARAYAAKNKNGKHWSSWIVLSATATRICRNWILLKSMITCATKRPLRICCQGPLIIYIHA